MIGFSIFKMRFFIEMKVFKDGPFEIYAIGAETYVYVIDGEDVVSSNDLEYITELYKKDKQIYEENKRDVVPLKMKYAKKKK